MVDPIYEHKALIFKALAHPIRVQIIEFLADGEKSVSEIIAHVGAKESNTSRHLGVLRAAGVVGSRKDGMNVHYDLLCPCLVNMFTCVNDALIQKARIQNEIVGKLS